VLRPAAVATHPFDTVDGRPARLGGAHTREANHFLRDAIKDGLAPEEVGWRVVDAIRGGSFRYSRIPSRANGLSSASDARLAIGRAERWKASRTPAKQRSAR
jgi:hypothetical protein